MRLIPAACVVAVAAVAIGSTSALAGSSRDIETLVALLKSGGTSVAALSNKETDGYCAGKHGFYVLDPKAKPPIDLLVICKEQVNLDDKSKLWEVLAHESTHVMQACVGDEDGKIFKPEHTASMLRELRKFAPHYYAVVADSYGSDDVGFEVEAFWMELQHPGDVIGYYKEACSAFLKSNPSKSHASKRS